jgi:hypothetical protein
MTNNYNPFYLFLLLFIPGSIVTFLILRMFIDFILRKFIVKPFQKKPDEEE